MIDVCNVTKKFGDFTAINDLSFHVDKGMIYGLVGYNGAGKTTLLKTVADVYRPEGGKVLIDGENVYDNPRAKQKIFYVPDDLYFLPYSSMERMAKFYNGFYPNFSFETFHRLTEVFGLDSKKRINGFSKGMQRQAELVLGLSTHPEILLLDESFDGLDPQKRAIVTNLVMQYVEETDTAVIISSHNLHELGGISDRIGLINGKALAMDCSVEEMSRSRNKIRVVCAHDFGEESLKVQGINNTRFKKDGKIVTFTTTDNPDEVEAKLAELQPLLVERFPLTLEEVFLEEMEGTDYDFSGIFNS